MLAELWMLNQEYQMNLKRLRPGSWQTLLILDIFEHYIYRTQTQIQAKYANIAYIFLYQLGFFNNSSVRLAGNV
jgi:hypothetical protein